jgi:hypothetical protein
MAELGIVAGWLDAINAKDPARAAVLSSDQVEVVGPRGRGSLPASALGDWLARSGFSSRPVRWFCGGDGRVVVELDARWTDPATGRAQDNLMIGALFGVADGRVASFERFDDGVATALAAAGMDEARDEVRTA